MKTELKAVTTHIHASLFRIIKQLFRKSFMVVSYAEINQSRYLRLDKTVT